MNQLLVFHQATMRMNPHRKAGRKVAHGMGSQRLIGDDPDQAGRAPRRAQAGQPILRGLLLLLSLLARPLWAQTDDPVGVGNCDAPNRRITELDALYQAAEQERRRLSQQNADLEARLQQTDAFAALSRQIEQQSTLLRRLAEQLEPDAKAPEAAAGQDADRPSLVDENARLRVELDATNRRLALLTEQFAEAHRLRLDALAEAEAARGSNAKLEARLRQRGQAADEALMRADKAEKLYAALEEAHVRISTENERLTRDLASARERQAETTRRLVELDSLLASAQARALPGAETERASSETPAERASAEPRGTSDVTETGSDADAGQPLPVIYRVRADDTLSGISNKVYGNPNDWPRIFEANRDLLQTPDDLALGMSLVIP